MIVAPAILRPVTSTSLGENGFRASRLPHFVGRRSTAGKSVEIRAESVTLGGMNVRLYTSPDDFGRWRAGSIRRDPVLFTTELTTLRTSTWPAGRLLLAAFDCDGAVGAALQMRDAVLLVNGLPSTMAKEAAARSRRCGSTYLRCAEHPPPQRLSVTLGSRLPV